MKNPKVIYGIYESFRESEDSRGENWSLGKPVGVIYFSTYKKAVERLRTMYDDLCKAIPHNPEDFKDETSFKKADGARIRYKRFGTPHCRWVVQLFMV